VKSDDGNSTDATQSIAAAAGARVLVDHGPGQGTAIRLALAEALHELVTFGDADGSQEVRDIPRLVEPTQRGGADLGATEPTRGRSKGARRHDSDWLEEEEQSVRTAEGRRVGRKTSANLSSSGGHNLAHRRFRLRGPWNLTSGPAFILPDRVLVANELLQRGPGPEAGGCTDAMVASQGVEIPGRVVLSTAGRGLGEAEA